MLHSRATVNIDHVLYVYELHIHIINMFLKLAGGFECFHHEEMMNI